MVRLESRTVRTLHRICTLGRLGTIPNPGTPYARPVVMLPSRTESQRVTRVAEISRGACDAARRARQKAQSVCQRARLITAEARRVRREVECARDRTRVSG